MPTRPKAAVGTLDLVLFALLTCGGDHQFVTTDEVAIQAFRLFPLKFCWDTFAHLPNWDRVRQWLSEAKKEKHGTLVEGFSGDRKEGWRLTPAGVRRLRFKRHSFEGLELAAAAKERYADLAPSSLVAYALDELSRSGRAGSLPLVTEVCARRFPLLFELSGFPGWPDSATVAEALGDAVATRLAKQHGDTHVGLTAAGESCAAAVRRRVDADSVSIRLEDIGRGLTHRAAKAVEELTRSRAWELFSQQLPVSDGLACEALQCSLQSHPKAIKRALDDYLSAATELGRPDVVEFLRLCGEALGIAIPRT